MRSSSAVVVVSYNTRDILRECLQSVAACGASTVIVADNGSTDGTLEMLQAEFPGMEVCVDPANPGYGSAANAAIQRCREEYLLLLNSDTIVPPNAARALASYLDAQPRVGVVGPRLRNADGSLQRSAHQFPTPFLTMLNYSWVGEIVGRVPLLRKTYRVASFAHDRAERVDWVMGAALAIRRRAFDAVGGFDPHFFMYYEEVDLCFRLLQAGWETHFVPVVDVVHLGGASTRPMRAQMFAQEVLSGLRFFHRHHSAHAARRAQLAFRFAVRSQLLIAAARSRLPLKPHHRSELMSREHNLRHLLLQLQEPFTP